MRYSSSTLACEEACRRCRTGFYRGLLHCKCPLLTQSGQLWAAQVQLTGITGRHLPRTRIHHYAVGTLIFCELGSESRGNFIVPLFGQFASFTVHFTSRSDCKLKPDGIL